MNSRLAAILREQSLGEEVANSISHGIGLLAALLATPILIVHAVKHSGAAYITGVCIFAASVVLLYLASTLYHALPQGKAKRVFRVIEHSAIYFLIAGTYTPFTLGVLQGAWGWTLFGLAWAFALAGVALKVFGRASHPIISTGLYLLMGWLIVVAAKPFINLVPITGLLLLVAGGLFYTLGVIFFAIDSRFRYAHFIWHLFVLAGTTCHFFAVLWYGDIISS